MRIIPLNHKRDALLVPDLVWDGCRGDLAVEVDPVSHNYGGMRARAQLATAVLIQLMTDRRVSPEELPQGAVNRGFAGEVLGSFPTGSRLWLLRRRHLGDPEIEILAQNYAREALQIFIDQKAVSSVDVVATANRRERRLDIECTLFGPQGDELYAGNFGILWEQMRGLDNPLTE